jgi:hypothetical protein
MVDDAGAEVHGPVGRAGRAACALFPHEGSGVRVEDQFGARAVRGERDAKALASEVVADAAQ